MERHEVIQAWRFKRPLSLGTSVAVTFRIRYKMAFYHICVIKLVAFEGIEKIWCFVFVLQLLNQKIWWFGFTALLIQFLLLLLLFSMVNRVTLTCISLSLPGGEKELGFVYYIFGRNHCDKEDPAQMEICALENQE